MVYVSTVIDDALITKVSIRGDDGLSENLTTLAGKNLRTVDPILRLIISLLDGTRGRTELAVELSAAIEVPFEEQEAFKVALPEIIEGHLKQIAAAGLLIK